MAKKKDEFCDIAKIIIEICKKKIIINVYKFKTYD